MQYGIFFASFLCDGIRAKAVTVSQQWSMAEYLKA